MSQVPLKWIMHIDMDAFFASVEQRDCPEYRGRPLVVGALPGKRGVVATCSYEARSFGIHSAMPISDAYRRCPDAIYLRPDMARYATASRQVMTALETISPVIEQASIDEAYVDISGLDRLFGGPEEIGELTRQRVRQAVDLSCSVGIGPNRLIAKLASDYRKPGGLTVVKYADVQDFLDPMPVSNLRGVGRQTLKGIHRLGIRNVAQLRGYSLERLQHYFGEKGGCKLHDQARGVASDRVGSKEGRKSISKENTFNQNVTDQRQLREKLRSLSSEVGRTARNEGVKGRVVTLKLRLEGFETHTRQRRLNEPTDADAVIFKRAWDLYRSSGYQGRSVRLIGLGISEWDSDAPELDLFDDPEQRKQDESLYATLDKVASKFGRGKLSLGLASEREQSDED